MITPWSWTTSNGMATAAETRRAYQALTSQGQTALFSYKVWNDLVSKIRETQLALNRSWNSQYATYSAARMNFVYDILYDKVFNAAVQNALYPLWTWSYMQNKVGYIGRTEVRGVDRYGETGADTVYGYYIIELAERLNVVIGIINGTTPTIDGNVQLQNILRPNALLRAPAAAPFVVRQTDILLPHGRMEAENLPTMNARLRISSPTMRAFLELDDISSRLEGHAWLGLQHNGKLIHLPSVTFIEMLQAIGRTDGTLFGVPSKAALANAIQQIASEAAANHIPSVRISLDQSEALSIGGEAVKIPSFPFDWTGTREMLEAQSQLTSERTTELTAAFRAKPVARALFQRTSPRPLTVDFADAIAHASDLGLGDIQPLNVNSVITELGGIAALGYSENKDMHSALVLPSPLAYALMETEHASTLLRAYFEAVCVQYGELDGVQSASAASNTRIRMLLPELLVADHSGSCEYHHDIRVDIIRHAHVAKAGHCIYPCEIGVQILSSLNAGHSAAMEHYVSITLDVDRTMNATLCRALGSSRVRAVHTINGGMARGIALPTKASMLIPLAEVSGSMSTVRERLLGEATASGLHGIAGELEVLRNIREIAAAAEDEMLYDASLGYVFNCTAAADLRMALLYGANLEAESQHGWQYPTIDGDDMTVYQVYRIENNRTALFLDPHLVKKWQDLTMDIGAEIDRQVYINAVWNGDIGVNIDSTMHAVERAAWEAPIQTGDNLLIRQTLRTYKPRKNTLEVT